MFFREFLAVMRGEGDIMSLVIALLAGLIVIFLVLPFHELAHGFVANKLGDPTAKNMGRLTFNPMAHVDPLGSALLVLFGFGWAKPVPVNGYYLRNPKRDMAIVALAGPVANIIAALVGGLLYNAYILIAYKAGFIYNTASIYVASFFSYYIVINATLAIFNLIPFPPLDGSRILSAFLPDRAYMFLVRYERVFFIILIVLMSNNLIGSIITAPTYGLANFVLWVTELPFKPFFA